jgi:hypothetical protein
MKRVISFSLFGHHPKYVIGALKNAQLAAIHYPGWICRFYVSPSTALDDDFFMTLLQLRAMENVEALIVPLGHELEYSPMFWRFMAADDPEVERFLSRDCDSRIGPEEAAAVEEWIKDDTILHTCRSHPAHGRPINGGMFGVHVQRPTWRAPSFMHAIRGHLAKSPAPGAYNDDQEWLSTWLWGWSHGSATQHDAVTRGAYPGSKPFPVKWPWPRFMGEVIEIGPDGEDVPREGDWKQIPKNNE